MICRSSCAGCTPADCKAASDGPLPATAAAGLTDLEAPLSSCKAVTTNPCKLCTPLGACLAFSGVQGCIPLLHGSQGCSTYIRRYLISHYREPVDIASSNFSEGAAVFGGASNLTAALDNVIRAYAPEMIGVATTCLSETIGDDPALIVHRWRAGRAEQSPPIVHVSTPSYRGTHADGYHAAVAAIVEQVAETGPTEPDLINIIPGMFSPADLRHLREIAASFGLRAILLPDYADRLDGGTWDDYRRITPGGTPIDDIRRMGRACATLEFAGSITDRQSAGAILARKAGTAHVRLAWPSCVRAMDALLAELSSISRRPVPAPLEAERARLLDACIDAHKYVFGRRAVVYGEVDLVVAIAALLCETGMVPAVCATGEAGQRLERDLRGAIGATAAKVRILTDVDFEDIADEARRAEPDLIIGHSKGYRLARELGVPLVRLGFPIHDRFGAARLRHIGYRGIQELFDRMVNALLERRQESSEIGFSYL